MKIGKHTFNNLRVVRALIQLLCFVFLPALYISAFSGIKAIYMSLITFSFDFGALLPQIIEVIAIIPMTMLLGRFFCGWMCAFGSFSDFFHFISHKILKRDIKVNPMLDGVLKSLKYIWLILLVVYVWTFNLSLFADTNPWDVFGMLFTFGKLPDFGMIFTTLLPAFLILIAILVGSFFIERFFCRYFCPLGAILAVASKLRLTSIKKPRTACGSCKLCSSHCPMQIDLSSRDKIRSADCINCFECVSSCPKKNAVYSKNESDVKPLVAGAVAASAITGIRFAGNFTSKTLTSNIVASSVATSSQVQPSAGNGSDDFSQSDGSTKDNENIEPFDSEQEQQNTTNNNDISENTPSAQNYKDGTYQGSGTGFRNGTTTVSVTVKGGAICDVTLISSEDTERFIDYSFKVVSQKIIETQQSDVDVVSGATYSSLGIMEAVENALSKAI